ncbi:MAG: hypothetical protein ACLT98_04250 [Eggerthellaceae bacterium]
MPAVTEPLFRRRLWSRNFFARARAFRGVVYAAAVPASSFNVIQSVVESVTASRDESGWRIPHRGLLFRSLLPQVLWRHRAREAYRFGVSPLSAPSGNSDVADSSNEEGSSSTESLRIIPNQEGAPNPVPPWWRIAAEISRLYSLVLTPMRKRRFLAALIGYYDNLAPTPKRCRIYAQFNSNCLSVDSDLRMGCFSGQCRVQRLNDAGIEVQNLAVPNGSAYAFKYEDISILYYLSTSATAALRRAWIINVVMENPLNIRRTSWLQFLKNLSDGKIIPLSDFEQRYPERVRDV